MRCMRAGSNPRGGTGFYVPGQKEQPVQRCDGSHEPIINMLALLRAYTDMLLDRTCGSSLGGSNVLTAGKSAHNLDSHSRNS